MCDVTKCNFGFFDLSKPGRPRRRLFEGAIAIELEQGYTFHGSMKHTANTAIHHQELNNLIRQLNMFLNNFYDYDQKHFVKEELMILCFHIW